MSIFKTKEEIINQINLIINYESKTKKINLNFSFSNLNLIININNSLLKQQVNACGHDLCYD